VTWADAPVVALVVTFLAVEAGYLTHRWRTVSQEYARMRKAHAGFAIATLVVVLVTAAIHLGLGVFN